jgi:hypothetical protein
MVEGVAQFRRRMQAIPAKVEKEVRREIERVVPQLVSQMEFINPLPGAIRIDWTWGAPPRGALALAQSRPDGNGIRATIYATSREGRFADLFADMARAFEFGTGPRFQRRTGRFTGRMPAQPYFFPVYRAERRRARSAITRAVRRAFTKS